METKTVKTPGGFTAIIRTNLTYDELVQIQSIVSEGMEINPEDQKLAVKQLPAIFRANYKAAELLLTSIKDPEGQELIQGANNLAVLKSLNAADGAAIMELVKTVWQSVIIPQKKGI